MIAGLAAAALAAWPSGSAPSLDGPLEGLAFGMDAEAAWQAAPALRDAMSFDLVASEGFPPRAPFADAHPEIRSRLVGGAHKATTECTLHTAFWETAWPTVDGAAWEVLVSPRGLTRVTARFDDPDAGLAALTAAWGPATAYGQTLGWTGDGVAAMLQDPPAALRDGEPLVVELFPAEPFAAVISGLWSTTAPWLGRPRTSLPPRVPCERWPDDRFAPPAGMRCASVAAPAVVGDTGPRTLELLVDADDRVVGLRSDLIAVDDRDAPARIAAVEALLGPADKTRPVAPGAIRMPGTCWRYAARQTVVCARGSLYVATGPWADGMWPQAP